MSCQSAPAHMHPHQRYLISATNQCHLISAHQCCLSV
ncbi:unnamed protein product, partial [Staurois parvus]